MNKKRILYIILIFSLLGIPLTIYLTYLHYKPEASTFCNFSDQFNCDIVNKSVYSDILGIPVALLGFLTYLIFFALTYEKFVLLKSKNLKRNKQFTKYLLILSVISFLFSLYLSFLEAFVILSWCIFCIISAFFVIVILICSFLLWKK